MSNKKIVDPRYAKTKEYAGVISKIAKIGKCPFCKENFKYHKHPILKKEQGWFITKSSWPYKNTKNHFLIISEEHKEELRELNKKDLESAYKLAEWARKKFNILGGGITLRFGQTTFTGATVCHLHFHLIYPELNKKTKRGKTVIFEIG